MRATPTVLNKNVCCTGKPSTVGRWGSAFGTVNTSFLFFPVLEPLGAIAFALPDEAAIIPGHLSCASPRRARRTVDRIAEEVAVEPGVELDKDSGKAQRELRGYHAVVGRLAPADM